MSTREIFFPALRLGVSCLGVLAVLSVTITAQAPPEFDVASFKVHPPDPGGNFSSSMRSLPNGQTMMSNISIRTIIGQAFPSRGSSEVLGLPDWASSQNYDVIVKSNRAVSRDEQRQRFLARLSFEGRAECAVMPA